MRNKSLNLARDILLGLALVGGVVVLVALAPGLGILIKPFAKKYRPRSLETNFLKRKLSKLEQDGLIAWTEIDGRTKLVLTTKGRQKVLEYKVEEMEIPEQKPWDGKYRFVMFDIPERKKLARDVLREKLVELGFKRTQKSVWCHPYPCTDEIDFLANLYQVRRYVTIIEGVEV